jgi:hypothetical protein
LIEKFRGNGDNFLVQFAWFVIHRSRTGFEPPKANAGNAQLALVELLFPLPVKITAWLAWLQYRSPPLIRRLVPVGGPQPVAVG